MLTPRSRADFLPTPPWVVSAPYNDQFGRGYLLSLSAPLAAPNGKLIGVTGADVPMAYAIPLEKMSLPQVDDIVAAALRTNDRKMYGVA